MSNKISSSYAEDRALIENLLGRYMYAMDFHDHETFASLFAEDARFDPNRTVQVGREVIMKSFQQRSKRVQQLDGDVEGEQPVAHRHMLTNIVIKVSGNTAVGRSAFVHFANANAKRSAELLTYGNYEDEFVKVDGEWLISYRKIYCEQESIYYTKDDNPAW